MKASRNRSKSTSVTSTHDVRLPLPSIWGNQASRDWSAYASDVERIIDAYKNHFEFDSDADRGRFLELLKQMLFMGFHLAATPAQRRVQAASKSGARQNAEKAAATRRSILDAYDATDSTLSEAERYAAVKLATGVKSDETIRKALRSR